MRIKKWKKMKRKEEQLQNEDGKKDGNTRQKYKKRENKKLRG